MSRKGRPTNNRGTVYKQRKSRYWWVVYPDREGHRVRESSRSTDRENAEQFLRDRLDDRDRGETSGDPIRQAPDVQCRADWFLERRSKPPYRSEKTHLENLNALKFLRPSLGSLTLSEITPEAIEDYIERRLRSGRRGHTKFGM